MVQELIMFVGQELDNMTRKENLQEINKLTNLRSWKGWHSLHSEDLETLENLSQERMESLEEHLDFDWIDDDPTECFDLG